MRGDQQLAEKAPGLALLFALHHSEFGRLLEITLLAQACPWPERKYCGARARVCVYVCIRVFIIQVHVWVGDCTSKHMPVSSSYVVVHLSGH